MDLRVAILLSVIISIGLFFLLRAIFCWYWKINARLAVQEKILSQLISLNNRMSKEEYQIKYEDIQQLLINYRMVNPEVQDPQDSTNKQESESGQACEPELKPQPGPTPEPDPKPKKPKKPYCPRCNEKNTFGEYCKFCGAELEDVDEE